MELVNLTPHPVVFRTSQGVDVVLPPSGRVARVATSPTSPASAHEGIPVPVLPYPVYGAIDDLPRPRAGHRYIVSLIVLAQCHGRGDVYAPGTGPQDGAIRDAEGRIVAVTRLVAAPGVRI